MSIFTTVSRPVWLIEHGIRPFFNLLRPFSASNFLFPSILFSANHRPDVITGAIPDSIGDCIDLREIDISNNALSSTLPSSLGDVRSLSLLGLFENQLSGTLPSTLGSLGLMEVLYLDNNSE